MGLLARPVGAYERVGQRYFSRFLFFVRSLSCGKRCVWAGARGTTAACYSLGERGHTPWIMNSGVERLITVLEYLARCRISDNYVQK